jgi:hypothetical protein
MLPGMSPQLIILFAFQAALAFAITWAIARLVLASGAPRYLRLVRNLLFGLALVLTPAIAVLYLRSLPPEGTRLTALLPALWVGLMLLAPALAMSLALLGAGRRKMVAQASPPAPPGTADCGLRIAGCDAKRADCGASNTPPGSRSAP